MRTLRAFRPSAVELEGRISLSNVGTVDPSAILKTKDRSGLLAEMYTEVESGTFAQRMSIYSHYYNIGGTPSNPTIAIHVTTATGSVDEYVAIANLPNIAEQAQVKSMTADLKGANLH